jgi:hypothetical protein
MIEVQLIAGAADNTFASIPFPDFELHGTWDHPSSLWSQWHRVLKILFAFDGFESELEYGPSAALFSPCIKKVKHPVVGPYSGVNLLVHPNALGLTASGFVLSGSHFELAVLGQTAMHRESWLIDRLRLPNTRGTRLVS